MDNLHQQLIAPAPPPPISVWPPAPGWWLVLAGLLVLGLLLPLLLRQLHQRRKRRLHSGMPLFADLPAELSDSLWRAEVNTRLKQQLKQRGDSAATRLFGEAWLNYLCSRYPNARRDALQPLAADLYRPDAQLSTAQRQALLSELQLWLEHEHV